MYFSCTDVAPREQHKGLAIGTHIKGAVSHLSVEASSAVCTFVYVQVHSWVEPYRGSRWCVRRFCVKHVNDSVGITR